MDSKSSNIKMGNHLDRVDCLDVSPSKLSKLSTLFPILIKVSQASGEGSPLKIRIFRDRYGRRHVYPVEDSSAPNRRRRREDS